VEPNRILWFSTALRPVGLVTGEFQPIALSVDEGGWVHLLVDELVDDPAGGGQTAGPRALWVLDPQGTRRVRFVLPRPLHEATAPPVIGYGHRIYLQGGGQLLALDPKGSIVWSRPIDADASAAMVTPNDDVLVAEGKDLVAFDERGQRRVVHSMPEAITTAPVLTTSGDGRLLLASSDTLYCLTPVPQPLV
jgi:hypothetical protein